MSTEDNKALIRRFIEEGWNQKNAAVFDELVAPDYVSHTPDGDLQGLEIGWVHFAAAFPINYKTP